MVIESGIPLPETAKTRTATLMEMGVGDSIYIEFERMQNWRYPMQLVMRSGDRYYFSRRAENGYRIWRHS